MNKPTFNHPAIHIDLKKKIQVDTLKSLKEEYDYDLLTVSAILSVTSFCFLLESAKFALISIMSHS